jgi:hypothetical protein
MKYEPGSKELVRTPQGEFALAFGRSLVAERFADAHGMLASSLRSSLSPAELEEKFASMIATGDGPPETAEVVAGDDDWPAKEPKDIGWVYVAIGGNGFNEAVTLTIAREEGRMVIREIEWGRP